jgi:hypothetical protein
MGAPFRPADAAFGDSACPTQMVTTQIEKIVAVVVMGHPPIFFFISVNFTALCCQAVFACCIMLAITSIAFACSALCRLGYQT